VATRSFWTDRWMDALNGRTLPQHKFAGGDSRNAPIKHWISK